MKIDNFEDFQSYFWEYISKNIVSDNDLFNDNKDFCDFICFDIWRTYEMSNVSIDLLCKMSENILLSVKRFRPVLK